MKCPHCFRGLPDEARFLSCSGPCPSETPANLTVKNGGVDVERKPHFDASADQSCPNCKTPSSLEACPECFGAIPKEWRETPQARITCVVMAGARTSGKSLYIGVLKRQLELFVERRHKSYLEPLGATKELFLERYEKAIFEDQQILPPTQQAAHDAKSNVPMIFHFRDQSGTPNILVLRDVAGEDLESLETRKLQLEFLTRADALIVLIDPLKIDQIVRVLQGKVQVGALGGDGIELLSNLLNFLRESEGKQKTSIPIALTLSKFDSVQKIKDTESDLRLLMSRLGSPFMRDPSMASASFDSVDGDLLQLEVESLFKNLDGEKLDNLLRQRCEEYRYFAVSSLGSEPSGKNINSVGIAPFRVLDPIKWVMKL